MTPLFLLSLREINIFDMKRIILTLILVATAATSAFAQFGVGAGFAQNTLNSNDADKPLLTNGLYVEGSYTMAIAGGLSFVPGLRYTFLGTSDASNINIEDFDLADFEASITQQYISVPLMLQYCFTLGEFRAFAFAGPTIEFGLASDLSVSGNIAGIGFGDSISLFGEDGIFTRTDVAVTGGAGVQIHKFFLKASYDFGLLNRSMEKGINLNEQTLRIGLGFLF